MSSCKAPYTPAGGKPSWYGQLCGNATDTDLCGECENAGLGVCPTVELRERDPDLFERNFGLLLEDMS